MKRFVLAFIAAYIFIFLWGWLLNGVVLKDIYAQTPNLWRPQPEMMSFFHWIIIGQALSVGRSFYVIANSSRTWLSDACGMGAACSHMALMATTRRDQFPGIFRSCSASIARNGRSADRIRAGLHQCL